MGLCCQLLYDLVLQPGRARQSTFLSLDMKTFDNHAATDAREEYKFFVNNLVCLAC